ncbi:hypothetical protein B296_00010459 [Ensete ventricosum]|uniref:Uncharacterized protein n=1 Tax=Ensete ventricosum TaxID=4639 RepID=A0A427AHC3_ENSVE|nr:hypothetical protein B296_00010459 [Ensete ventricosum]
MVGDETISALPASPPPLVTADTKGVTPHLLVCFPTGVKGRDLDSLLKWMPGVCSNRRFSPDEYPRCLSRHQRVTSDASNDVLEVLVRQALFSDSVQMAELLVREVQPSCPCLFYAATLNLTSPGRHGRHPVGIHVHSHHVTATSLSDRTGVKLLPAVDPAAECAATRAASCRDVSIYAPRTVALSV